MKTEAAAVVIVLVIFASFLGGYAAGYTVAPVVTSTTTLVSTTTETFTTSYPEPSRAIPESFSFSGRSQVAVNQLWAVLVPSGSGRSNVTFYVNFENLGPSPIYFIGGWVNALSVSLAPNSTALVESPSALCPGAIFFVTLQAGQNYTIAGPDCGTGHNYQVYSEGLAVVQLSFGWTTNSTQRLPFSNMTNIQAQFKFV